MHTTIKLCYITRTKVCLSNSWRSHISYLKYLNVCTTALHKVLKDDKAAKYQRFSAPGYSAQKPDGSGGSIKVDTVPAEIKDY
mmetsp:Transcript_34265/g.53536  ORF Transcript_34265/g.53536 Transcript_34265/m.53536 type:complete len:83 (+) Transcript_34265:28-276(+)